MTAKTVKLFKNIRLLVITLVVARSLYACVITAPTPPPALLVPATLPADYSVPPAIVADQMRIVTLDPARLTGRFSLTLLDNTSYIALVDRVEEQGPGHFVWLGHLSGQQGSLVEVRVEKEQVVGGFIELKHVRYELQQLHDNFYALYTNDTLT